MNSYAACYIDPIRTFCNVIIVRRSKGEKEPYMERESTNLQGAEKGC